MTTHELLPELQSLPRIEKLRIVQFLVGELAREEELQPFTANAAYPLWSPYYTPEAAATLQNMLDQEKRDSHG